MEQVFPLEIFRKKGNTFGGIPLFSFSPEIPEILYHTSAMLLGKSTRLRSRKWRPPLCFSVQHADFSL